MADQYQIVKQEQVLQLSDAGAPQNAMRVDFISLPSGTRASVTVPLSEYSPMSVRTQIEALQAKIEDVHTLGQS